MRMDVETPLEQRLKSHDALLLSPVILSRVSKLGFAAMVTTPFGDMSIRVTLDSIILSDG